MNKAIKNYIAFIVMAGLGLLATVSGLVLWLALPRGGQWGKLGDGVASAFWSLSRQTWLDIHDWAAVAITAMVVLHLFMHRKWIVGVTKKVFRYGAMAPLAQTVPLSPVLQPGPSGRAEPPF